MRSAVPWNGGAQKRDPVGTQTQDPQNRNLMLYSTELRGRICEKLCKINDKAYNHQIICSTKESFNRKKNRNFATNYILNEE